MLTTQEWKYYLDDSELERDIERLGEVLCIEKKPAEFRILPCIGITKDALNRRYGVVFRLPAYLETLPPYSERGAVSIVRKPVSLLELLDNSAGPVSARGILDLKIRFQLARQLVQSIYILHAVGWVHKKYVNWLTRGAQTVSRLNPSQYPFEVCDLLTRPI